MDLLNAVDTASLIINIGMLAIGGAQDKKHRQLPLLYVLIYGAMAAAFMVYRLLIAPDYIKTAIAVSSVLSMGMVGGLAVLALTTRMIGSGDILVIVLSFMATPYVPRISAGKPPLPVFVPLSVIVSALAVYLRYLRETKAVRELPKGFRRVVVMPAGELKKMNPLTYYPVYVQGKGYVHEKVFKSNDPMQESIRILSDARDTDVVYAVPSYPFVYYYATGFAFAAVILVLYDLLILGLGL